MQVIHHTKVLNQYIDKKKDEEESTKHRKAEIVHLFIKSKLIF